MISPLKDRYLEVNNFIECLAQTLYIAILDTLLELSMFYGLGFFPDILWLDFSRMRFDML